MIARNNVDDGRGFKQLMYALVSGQEIPEEAWRPWGLSVEVVPDMDQGD